ncbi:MAG: glycoside hydrolase family 2 protein, partial [Oscillospiraceae bacterium]|nr:glycoside hydrolase family 2 protein [Oscillospiraceae bacterium]
KSTITVYTNQPSVTLYINGKKAATQTGEKVFRFPITVSGEMKIEARAGGLRDEISIRKVDKPNPAYKLGKDAGNAGDWV